MKYIWSVGCVPVELFFLQMSQFKYNNMSLVSWVKHMYFQTSTAQRLQKPAMTSLNEYMNTITHLTLSDGV